MFKAAPYRFKPELTEEIIKVLPRWASRLFCLSPERVRANSRLCRWKWMTPWFTATMMTMMKPSTVCKEYPGALLLLIPFGFVGAGNRRANDFQGQSRQGGKGKGKGKKKSKKKPERRGAQEQQEENMKSRQDKLAQEQAQAEVDEVRVDLRNTMS